MMMLPCVEFVHQNERSVQPVITLIRSHAGYRSLIVVEHHLPIEYLRPTLQVWTLLDHSLDLAEQNLLGLLLLRRG